MKRKFYIEVHYSSGEAFDFGPAWADSPEEARASVKPRGTVNKLTVEDCAPSHACLNSDHWWSVCPRDSSMSAPKAERRCPMSAHTPGPWKMAKRGSSNAPLILAVDTAGKEIACTQGAFRDQTENEANAHLIASAPDLLAIAKAVRAAINAHDSDHPDFVDSCADVCQMLDEMAGDVRAAIAKAEDAR